IHVGYRAWLRSEVSPAYWFGHGLGYADIELAGVRADASVLVGATIEVTGTVVNTGERGGKVVLLVFAERPGSSVERPVRWLVGFQAVRVPAGESAEVPITVPSRLLAHWEDGWRYEPGTFTLRLGTTAARLPLSTEIELVP